jgi:hypothetical protein
MHKSPVSLTDDRFKEWRHMLGSAAFRNQVDERLIVRSSPPAKHAWRIHRRQKTMRATPFSLVCKQSKLLGDPQEQT